MRKLYGSGKILAALAVLVGAALCAASRASAQSVEPLPIESALRYHTFAQLTPFQVSSDGKWLAYVVKDNQRTRVIDPVTQAKTGVWDIYTGTDVWISNTETGEAKNLTGGNGNNWLPSWSPDGRYLAFISDRDGGSARLWVWDAKKNDVRKASDLNVRQAGQLYWTPDSQRVVTPIVPDGMSLDDYVKRMMDTKGQEKAIVGKVPGSTVTLYQSPAKKPGDKEGPVSDSWSMDRDLRDLTLIDVTTGKSNVVVKGHIITAFYLSPDGSQLAYSVFKRFEKAGAQQMMFDLAVTNLANGRERTVASNVPLDDNGSFGWSPDNQKLSYRTERTEQGEANCFVVSVTDGAPRNVSNLSSAKTRAGRPSDPIWDKKSEYLYFIFNKALWRTSVSEGKAAEFARIPNRNLTRRLLSHHNALWTVDDGKAAVVLVDDDQGKQDGFYKIDLQSGQSTKLLENGQCFTCANVSNPFSISGDGSKVVFLAENEQRDNDAWAADSNFQNLKQVTHLNPQYEKYQMGATRLIAWTSDDGEPMHGALLLPAGYQEGKRYPMVVWVYASGLLSETLHTFGGVSEGPFNMQLLATRGYVVLLPDSPQHPGTPLMDVAKTVLPGVSKTIELGIADSDHIGVMGQSNGGYSTLALIVQTKRFKAAIDIDGMGDLVGLYTEMDNAGQSYGMGVLEHAQDVTEGTPWEYRYRFLENSPFYYLDRVETPLMIVHGAQDNAVASFLGDQIFVGLRRLGKEVEYAKYEGEGHSQIYWGYANQLDFTTRMIAWFDKWLKNPPAQ